MPGLNFTVEGRLGAISDIQRNFMFEVMIPDIGNMTGKAIDQEGLIIRTKTCSIPGRGQEEIESYFMGMKQLFPGRPTIPNKLTISIDETEDQIVTQALYKWRQKIFDIDPKSTTAGYSQALNKRAMSTTINLRMYKFNGVKMPNDIVFTNAWPSECPDIELAMTANEKIAYSVTFTYDYWLLKKS
jgi:hypothetical protein